MFLHVLISNLEQNKGQNIHGNFNKIFDVGMKVCIMGRDIT